MNIIGKLFEIHLKGKEMNKVIRKSVVTVSIVVMMLTGVFANKVTAVAASGNTTVYITKTGECYHSDGCASLRRSKIETTLQSAVDRGYRACSKCHPGSLDASSSAQVASTSPAATNANASAVVQAAAPVQAASAVNAALEALKTYKGNTSEFNAYSYYVNNADLQTAIGLDGDKLLEHYNKYGKTEGRIATAVNDVVEVLKSYKGNTSKFNAYTYYINNADLQTAIGADGDKLLEHYNKYGKAEGRKAK